MTEYVTLVVCTELIEMQDKSFLHLVLVLTDELRTDMRSISSDVHELKASLQYSQKDIVNLENRMNSVETKFKDMGSLVVNYDEDIESLADKQEYLENYNRRNNVNIFGLKEEKDETKEQSENLVVTKIKELLHINGDLKVKRAHRVGRPRYVKRSHDGSKVKVEPKPRPTVARFETWKQKEKVIKGARTIKIKLTDVMFLEDYSQRTLKRRRMQFPKLIDERKRGKLAFIAMDRLILTLRAPRGGSKTTPLGFPL